ncbi:uncharacterized protein L969DRAFT_47132 [Mixia osmundae IAM 14324]|uniref:NADH:flavin oxidoreductase/NADH oxidase N-terminal domain-containing protein n=1 Tax=Mixia osmundae (strain CBS 9802 / IAM 14324 / JCM 22182 / KY 12970) TaxID=764103 RepID=G7DVF0_MIXOS|nr:uncharacterized protein L969DRAFT_47132 [Mixia osmundae IAM 14324]KEI40338.1 hypothetical protein L969DRAFT_47132 [Mixia osmundae IAM 14324]GAA94560.1 hypothetical protein E5Q_01212 [Mixia osmundae IAM 14324]
MSSSKLFKPYNIGPLTIGHRVVMAPLTRFRANKDHTHTDMAIEYYSQRASVPGTLLFSEATLVSAQAGGCDNAPGIWSDAQVDSWKRVTEAVHAKGSFIGIQLWANGRQASPEVLARDGLPYVSASDVPMAGKSAKPTPLTHDQIKSYIADFALAARNARRAGFDLVELHAANGYLLNQFIDTNSNTRTDEYGGSTEKRLRFVKEVIDAVVAETGQDRAGIRLSPFSSFGDMRDQGTQADYTALIEWLRDTYPSFAFIHVIEARVAGSVDASSKETTDFALDAWRRDDKTRAYLAAGGFNGEDGQIFANTKDVAIVYGRHYISNPDLPLRIAYNHEMHPYDRSTFYSPGSSAGYIDQPFATDLIGKQLPVSAN